MCKHMTERADRGPPVSVLHVKTEMVITSRNRAIPNK
jgi:hypothetical protein